MALRFYMDQDSLNKDVVSHLRAAGIDVLTAEEVGMREASDREQLVFAALERRVIYTGNRKDYARLHREWMATVHWHAGIVARIHQQLSVGEQLRALKRLATTFEADEMANRFEYLEKWLPPRG